MSNISVGLLTMGAGYHRMQNTSAERIRQFLGYLKHGIGYSRICEGCVGSV